MHILIYSGKTYFWYKLHLFWILECFNFLKINIFMFLFFFVFVLDILFLVIYNLLWEDHIRIWLLHLVERYLWLNLLMHILLLKLKLIDIALRHDKIWDHPHWRNLLLSSDIFISLVFKILYSHHIPHLLIIKWILKC